jgi:hypothetical protein
MQRNNNIPYRHILLQLLHRQLCARGDIRCGVLLLLIEEHQNARLVGRDDQLNGFGVEASRQDRSTQCVDPFELAVRRARLVVTRELFHHVYMSATKSLCTKLQYVCMCATHDNMHVRDS